MASTPKTATPEFVEDTSREAVTETIDGVTKLMLDLKADISKGFGDLEKRFEKIEDELSIIKKELNDQPSKHDISDLENRLKRIESMRQ